MLIANAIMVSNNLVQNFYFLEVLNSMIEYQMKIDSLPTILFERIKCYFCKYNRNYIL